MRLVRFADGREGRAGAVVGDAVIDLSRASSAKSEQDEQDVGLRLLPADILALLELGDVGLSLASSVVDWVCGVSRPANRPAPDGKPYLLPLNTAKLTAPIVRPQKIIGVGLNYRDHCQEMKRDLPTDIRTFGMFANALVGHEDQIILPRTSNEMDFEAELVVVIGSAAKHVPEERALEYVAGYTIGNDVSARDHQRADPQVSRGKSGDTHAPIGPWIVTRDEIPDPGALPISLSVNGIVRQSSNTSELVFPVAQIISYLSTFYTLEPGDLIFTGTPAGVAAGGKPPEWLKPGDRVDVTIDGIGTLSNSCVAEPE